MKDKPKSISQKRLVQVFEDIKNNENSETRFCFLLGAGASKSSGIPTGWELATKWYKELKNILSEKELEEWEKEIEFKEKNIGAYYPEIYQKRFEALPEVGYETLIELMEDKTIEPSTGYVILAQILAEKKHNFVITTNFDQLVEDAVRLRTVTKPLVIGHEVLAGFISSQSKRPTIIKVHRDLFLHPISDEGTKTLDKQWKKNFKALLKNHHLLVIGYGGNDGSLMDYLKSIDASKRKPIYWCIREEKGLNAKIKEVLGKKDYVVKIDSFDELMIGLNDEVFQYSSFGKLGKGITEGDSFVTSEKERIINLENSSINLLNEEETLPEVKKLFKRALKYVFDAGAETDKEKAKEIYIKALKEYPKDSILLATYADFLFEHYEDYDGGEKYYKKAIEINPKGADVYVNWGSSLDDLAKTKKGEEQEALHKEAIEKYKKATEINPKYHQAYTNWGNSLVNLARIKEEVEEQEALYKQAFEKYKKATEINPNYANAYNNWGTSLADLAMIKKGEEQETLYTEALEKYKKAIELNPKDADAYYNWGTSLDDLARIKKGEEQETLYTEAIEKYEKATKINPKHHQTYTNWGVSLGVLAAIKEEVKEQETLYTEAIKKYKKATEINPKDAKTYTNWGNSLDDLAMIKKGKEQEALYKQTIEKYKKATEINPNYANAYANWGLSLSNLAKTKKGEEQEALYKQAIEKYKKAIELGGSSYYNLSCVYALQQKKEEALHFLDIALGRKEIAVDFVLTDEDWQEYLNDPEFKVLKDKYRE